MKNYPMKEGKHGPIYQVAQGLYVALTEYGTWQLIFKRSRERKKKTFGSGEAELRRAFKAAECLANRLGLALDQQRNRTFGQVAQEWLELNTLRWQPQTKERYQGIVRDFLRPLNNLPVDQVDRIRVKRLLAELLKIRAPKTVELTYAVISGIFSEANELGYISQNPASGLLKKLLPPKNKRARSEPDPFSRQDLRKFLEVAWEKLAERLALVLETMAMTGMRLGEVLAMRVEHLEIQNLQYYVTETNKNGRFGPPKSGKRLIDLEDSLVARLERYVKELRKKEFAAGKQVDLLFSGLTQRMVQRAMERACTAAKLRRRSPHDLRHTYATLLLMDHYSPAYVQKQLGHHSISMTVDTYGHWIPGEGKKDLAKTLRGTEPWSSSAAKQKALG